MKTKTRKMLPKTEIEIFNGGLYLQRVRCGKQNCRCARGEPHLAYYFFTRRDGKLVKTYVRQAELKQFAKIADEAKFWRLFKRKSNKDIAQALKKTHSDLRETAKQIEERRLEMMSEIIKEAVGEFNK